MYDQIVTALYNEIEGCISSVHVGQEIDKIAWGVVTAVRDTGDFPDDLELWGSSDLVSAMGHQTPYRVLQGAGLIPA